jgi:hypothetical protein
VSDPFEAEAEKYPRRVIEDAGLDRTGRRASHLQSGELLGGSLGRLFATALGLDMRGGRIHTGTAARRAAARLEVRAFVADPRLRLGKRRDRHGERSDEPHDSHVHICHHRTTQRRRRGLPRGNHVRGGNQGRSPSLPRLAVCTLDRRHAAVVGRWAHPTPPAGLDRAASELTSRSRPVFLPVTPTPGRLTPRRDPQAHQEPPVHRSARAAPAPAGGASRRPRRPSVRGTRRLAQPLGRNPQGVHR